ncbi:hypothetical protein pEaSNUABM37_00187 [Erwinia phage pEa_SNUABM_37]|nr:hypothetical protein pEaSNUABM37_00187 [Erwinia phage pEa_SNUABM_37]QXO10657.1 hypothetical protein pEaSNUABM48_00187 [Erwinia phage pEa_SNUABM_48]
MNTVQNVEAVNSFNVLILVIGLALLLVVIVLSYREYRHRQFKAREASTRIMIGSFDLYHPVDRLKATALIDDLYQMYLESYRECGSPIENNQETFRNFVIEFAHPYVMGKVDLSKWPDEVAKVFRDKHYNYVSQHKSA